MTNTVFRGGVVSLYNLFRYIDRNRYELLYITCSDGDHVERIRDLGVECYVFPLPRSVLDIGRNRFWGDMFKNILNVPAIVVTVFRIARFLRKSGVCLLHTHDQKSGLLGAIIGFVSRVPVVWHVRDIPNGAVRILDLAFGAFFVRQIIAISGSIAELFERNIFTRKKLRVIHNGVDLSVFNQSVSKDHFRKEQDVSGCVVGQVSTLIPLKGIQYFIEAAHLLSNKGLQATYFVVGDNPVAQYRGFEDHLKQKVIDLGIQNKFKFLPFRYDIQNAMAGFDIFVFPSFDEPFGKVLIEAAALKVPIIACDRKATREIFPDADMVILVPPRDGYALAMAIEKLCRDRELAERMKRTAYERVHNVFDIKNTTRKIQQTYEEVLNR